MYQDTLENDKENESTKCIMIVGCHNQGKISLARWLLGQSLDDITNPNEIDVRESMYYVRDGKWQILTVDKVDEYNSQWLAHVAVNIKYKPIMSSPSEVLKDINDMNACKHKQHML